MQISVKKLYEERIGAIDGDIGHVKDLYFDDKNWAVRYLVTDTGSWLSERKVLISPYSFRDIDQVGKRFQVHLTKAQIEKSPSIDEHKPVSRQFEDEYFRYYGLPFYWQGDGLWGASGFPVIAAPPLQLNNMPAPEPGPMTPGADPHLRSVQAVVGYDIHAVDGAIGHVSDFMLDDRDWTLRQMVVKTGGWFSGAEVLISTSDVDRIVYTEAVVHVHVTRAVIERSPPLQAASSTTRG